MLNLVERSRGFMGSTDSFDAADIIIVGAPMDLTFSFRPGTGKGPQQVRLVSYGLEEYSIDLDRDLSSCRYYDAGDIVFTPGTVEATLNRIGAAAAEILAAGKFPLVLGGEHLVSLPVIEEIAKVKTDLAVIHFDAHADLREDYLGSRLSHATVMRRVADVVGSENLYQFGIRSGTREEIKYARGNTNIYFNKVVEPLKEILDTLKDRPVYISVDIDVVDPAYAPGTGAPEPCGCSAGEILEAVRLLGNVDVIGFDLVELNPLFDPTQVTALLGAKIVREAILALNT